MNPENLRADAYRTRDVYLTASLLACGCTISAMPKKEKQYTFFITHDTQDMQTLVAKYWDGAMLVDAKKLFSSFRELRARMYN